jgi:hypothetical protein
MTTDRLAQRVTDCHVLTGYTPVPHGHLSPAPERVSHVQMSAMTATALRRREGLNPWLVVSDTGAGLDSGVFAVLDRALNRRASRHDPNGAVRR